MSMIMQYARLRAEELAELRRLVVADPDGAFDYVDELADRGADDAPPAELRSIDTDKAWEAISHLLERSGPPSVNIITGGTVLTGDDWGYEPPRLFPPDEVATAATYLQSRPFEVLARHYDAGAFEDADIYPPIWDQPDALDYVSEWYDDLVEFVVAAAKEGDALVVWLT